MSLPHVPTQSLIVHELRGCQMMLVFVDSTPGYAVGGGLFR